MDKITLAEVKEVQSFCSTVKENVEKVIIGKGEVIDQILVALLCSGHVLAEDVPGVGKTMMARALSVSLGLKFNRIQFTPDLLPSDVTGVSIYNQKINEFEFKEGPIFAQIVLADEINRATPRTQSALLECMEERQVTVDGKTRKLSRPFLVMATQNPVEYEGTFPLPEAQLDRFLMRISLGYPTEEEENEILVRLQYSHPVESIENVVDGNQLLAMQDLVKRVFVEESVREYIVRLVQATRTHQDVALGASPRGSLALYKTAQAFAAVKGREYVIPDDVKYLAPLTLKHRLILKPESSLRGRTEDRVLQDLLESVPVELEEIG
ncbi:MAG TPA: MoxR family ATPase [Firmicutes bacterium]|jgi:MoxR-like ATPase|nr:MoxR family ATPase [Bacillota bacterium]